MSLTSIGRKAPAEVEEKQLRDVHIQIIKEDLKKEEKSAE